jgi:hypothetical protein
VEEDDDVDKDKVVLVEEDDENGDQVNAEKRLENIELVEVDDDTEFEGAVTANKEEDEAAAEKEGAGRDEDDEEDDEMATEDDDETATEGDEDEDREVAEEENTGREDVDNGLITAERGPVANPSFDRKFLSYASRFFWSNNVSYASLMRVYSFARPPLSG